MDVGGRECLAADGPVAAFELLDADRGDAPQALAFHGDNGFGDLAYATLADALPHELISDLARLHWLFITARESSFRLRGAEADPGEIGRLLDVRYYLAGSV